MLFSPSSRTRRARAGAAFLILVAGLLNTPSPASAAEFAQDFEQDQTADYSALQGKNAEGSSLEVSTEKAHQGQKSLKLSYKLRDGYIEFNRLRVEKTDFTGDKLYLSVWVNGTGRRDFDGGAVRFLDSHNETFQFDIPGFAEALAGEGWRELRAEIDLTKTGAHWGDNSDGKLDRPLSYLGLAASRSAQTEVSGTVYLDDLRLSDKPFAATSDAALTNPNAPAAAPNAANAIELAPVLPARSGPGAAFLRWVVAPGAPIVFQGKVNAAAGQSVSWKVRDAFDQVLTEGKQSFDANTATGNFSIRLKNPPQGVLYASAAVMNSRDEVVAQTTARVAVMRPHQRAVPIQDFVWGVAAHVGRNDGKDAPQEIALMRLLGFAAARSDMSWESIEPQPDVWTWDKQDQLMALFQKQGITPMPLLAYGTRWATTGDANSPDWHDWYFSPPRTAAYLGFVRAAVNRYKGQTRYWEIWNEPDIDFWRGTVEQYTALVDATVPVIKAQEPDALVMNGGFSETQRRPDFIPTYLRTVKARPDIYAIHTHGAFENLLRAEATVNANLGAAGLTGTRRPQVWLNEAGFSNVRGISEGEQAITLVKKMAYAPAAGWGAYVWYDLRDDGTDPNEDEHNFGLVKQDFQPKASAVAASVLLDTIGSLAFKSRLPLKNSGYGLIYQGNNRTVLTAWRQPQTQGDAVFPLVLRATSATKFQLTRRDIFGNSTPVASRDGVFLLALSNVPQYIEAPGNVSFDLVANSGLLLDYPTSIVVAPGENLPQQIKIANPFSETLRGRLQVGATALEVSVAPQTTRAYAVAVKSGAVPGAREVLQIQLVSPQLPAPLSGTAEVQTAYVVPRAPEMLSVELPRGNRVSLFEATPMRELHFQDAADLGASFQAQRTSEGVQMSVKVADQIHFPVAENQQWWQGDSLQWAVGLPDGRMMEWMAALLPSGPQMILTAPGGTGATVPVSIKREGNQTLYQWLLPRTLPDGSPWPARFNFDFIVNDNDGQGRKGWIEWTPGIGREKDATAFVPMLVQP